MDSSVFPTAGDKGGGVFPTHQPKICSSPPPGKNPPPLSSVDSPPAKFALDLPPPSPTTKIQFYPLSNNF